MESKLVLARKEAMENMELMAKEEVDFQEDGSADYYSYYYSSLLQEDELGMGMGMMGMGKMGMMGMGAPQDDEAAAVGDPHMTLTGGEQDDLCCNGGHCEPCPLALFSKVDSAELNLAAGREAALASMHVEQKAFADRTLALTSMSMESKLASAREEAKEAMGKEAKESMDSMNIESKLASGLKDAKEEMGKESKGSVDSMNIESKLASARKEVMDTVELMAAEEVDLGMGMGKMGMGKIGMMGMGKMGMMGMGKMGMMGMGMGMGAADDEAAAVGDPHLTLSNGAKQDLCCKGTECHPCPSA